MLPGHILLPWMCNMLISDNKKLNIRMKNWGLLQAGVDKLRQRLPRDWQVELLPNGNQSQSVDPTALVGRLGCATGRYAVTGSMAANQWAPLAPTRLLTIYTDDAAGFAGTLGLRPTDTGTNVMLVEPKDDYVYRGSERRDAVCYVAPSQAAADLLSSPGRGPLEAEELIEWMRQNEGVWRIESPH